MEVDDFHSPQQPAAKYSRVDSNGTRLESSKIGLLGNGSGSSVGGAHLEDKTDVIPRAGTTNTGGDVLASTRFGRQWQHSSRIIRVSRASGGKDRHSKVWTAKGPRDRRVRLSVNTAIQFYDLQDRLGYDQPSKAVEWLIKAAAESINELPSLSNINFPPETPRQLVDEPRPGNNVVDSADVELDGDHTGFVHQDHGGQGNQELQQVGSMSMSKSGCSSNNSETSKGSGLSLSRTEIRVKARERARERTAKEKETGNETLSRVTVAAHHHPNNTNDSNNVSSMGQTSSFTQLLTAGINNLKENTGPSSTPSPSAHNERGRNIDGSGTAFQWLSSSGTTTIPMADYFGSGFMGLSTSRPNNSIQHHLGNGPLPHVMTLLPFSGSHELQQHQQQQQQQQQLPFFLDHQHHHPLIQIPNSNNTNSVVAGGGGGGDYNLNFSISSSSTTSGLAAGFNRGTLQSNSSSSPSFLSYLQRFSATDGGSSVPFFLGGAPISPIVENQHHHYHQHDHHQQFNPAGLHLNYGDGARHSDDKGKGKN